MTAREPESAPPLPAAGTSVEVLVEDLGSRGQGVGRTAAGVVVMVAGAVPGDRVRARVVRRHRNRVDAEVAELLAPAAERCPPRCAHFGTCGGCSLQVLPAAAQRAWKTRRLSRLLGRQGHLPDAPVAAAAKVGPAYGYRGRMSFSGRLAPDGPRLGLHDAAGAFLPISECHLPHPAIMEVFHAIHEAMREAGAAPAAVEFRLDLRRAAADGRLLATVAWHPRPPGGVVTALDRLPRRRPGLTVVQRGAGIRRCSGEPDLAEVLADVRVPLDARVFVQTHPQGATALYREALVWLAPAAPGPFLELYAGVGVLARAAAGRFGAAVAVEASPVAVRLGSREAGSAVTFLRDEARLAVDRLAAAGRTFVAAAVNPPRSGMHASLPQRLAQMGVRRLAYISCHPATLARDLARLAAAGYTAVQVRPFDLFPQTAEVEVLACLEMQVPAPR